MTPSIVSAELDETRSQHYRTTAVSPALFDCAQDRLLRSFKGRAAMRIVSNHTALLCRPSRDLAPFCTGADPVLKSSAIFVALLRDLGILIHRFS